MENEVKFVDGLFCNDKPEWMSAKLGITPKFIEFYNENKNEKGNLTIDVMTSQKTGKQYAKLNDFVPKEKDAFTKKEDGSIGTSNPLDDISVDQISF